MAAVTVTGTVNGVSISINTNTALQTALAQQIIAAAGSAPALLVTSTPAVLTAGIAFDLASGAVLSGTNAIPAAQVVLGANGSQNQVYTNNGTAVSTVVAADNANASIVNDNPFGAMLAQTGAGGNVLLGLAGQNNFFTGNGGASDIVVLNGSSNALTSRGQDAVLVGGPSTVTASAGGNDNILMTTGTTLAFINGSRTGGDTITGTTNSAIVIAGTGATSVTAAGGPESFFVDTASGNVTLNGDVTGNDAFTFVKNAATTPGAAQVLVNGFHAGDTVNVHGYAGVQFSVAQAGGGTVLSLTDGSSVTFSNASAAAITGSVKVI